MLAMKTVDEELEQGVRLRLGPERWETGLTWTLLSSLLQDDLGIT